jgi:putative chitinase
MCISQSVGRNSPNQQDDVTVIQALLNLNLPRLPGVPFLTEDGSLGPHSQSVIELFQTTVATPGSASGVIEPGSPTLAALRAAVSGAFNSTTLQILMPLSSADRAALFASPLVAAMAANQINTPRRQAHFLSQLGHESGSLVYTSEIANGTRYEGRLDLGNTKPGDGPRFKGRGLIQITGRTNYTNYGHDRGKDCVTEPNNLLLATDPNVAADCSGWYWAKHHLNELADNPDDNAAVLAISTRINGDPPNGVPDRTRRFKLAKCLLVS